MGACLSTNPQDGGYPGGGHPSEPMMGVSGPAGAGGTMAEVIFFPDSDYHNGPSFKRLANLLNRANKSLDVCVFTITDNRIAKILKALHRRGVRVRVITDDDQRKSAGSDIDELEREGILVYDDRKSPMKKAPYPGSHGAGPSTSHMHHKFAVIDESILITGSYNWTRSACMDNWENVIATNDPRLVRPYVNAFEGLLKTFKY